MVGRIEEDSCSTRLVNSFYFTDDLERTKTKRNNWNRLLI